jgi:hypothetical protein
MQQLTYFILSANTYDEAIIKDIENICDGTFSPVAPSYINNIYYSTGGKGTSDMVSRAKKSGIEVKEIQNE